MMKILLALILFLGIVTTGHADEDNAMEQKAEKAEKLTVYDQGFWLYKDDGSKSMRIGGYLEIDGRFFLEPDDFYSEFLIRRARLYATGQITDLWGYMLMARWDKEKAGIHYAWIDTLLPKYARLRFGMFKQPFGLEALYSDFFWDFDERSIGTENYLHIEDIGAMFFGKTDNERLEYGCGVFNGNGREAENNAGKEVVGRIVIAPFRGNGGFFDRLYIGASGSYGRTSKNLSGDDFHTGGGTKFWIWSGDDDTPLTSKGSQTKLGADFEWLHGSAALRAEWLHLRGAKVHFEEAALPFHGTSWYAEGSYLVTGEEVPRNGPVIPHRNFQLCQGGGALQLAARYERFLAPKKFIEEGFATGSYRAQGVTLAANWFFNSAVVLKFDWQYLTFAEKVKIHSRYQRFESVVTARLQAEF